jgi:hypothetical protein
MANVAQKKISKNHLEDSQLPFVLVPSGEISQKKKNLI